MDHFDYKSGIYHAEDVGLDTLAKEIGTPFYCYSSSTLARHYDVFSSQFKGMDTRVHYAVKANDNLAVLNLLAKHGAGADVVSIGEIHKCLAAGFKPEDIVFSGVGKTAEEMHFALEQGIYQFNVESEPELELLNQVALSLDKKAPVAIRVNPDVDPKTHAKISTGQKASKFGVAMSQALSVYQKAAAMEGIYIQGVSMHIGSQLTTLEPFKQAFARMKAFVGELRANDIAVRTLDVGGGLGIPYGKEEPPLPEAYAAVVKEELSDLQGCRILFEPGRLLVGNAGILVAKVLYVKRSEGKIFVIVDAAMNDLLRPALYDAHHEIVPVAPRAEAHTETVDVVGPVCETGDTFMEACLMKVPEAGDLLAFRSAGAYGAVMASTYNARPLVPEVMVNGKEYALIRPRGTYESLIERDIIPGW